MAILRVGAFAALSFCLAMLSPCRAADAADRRPNIVLIVADDMGWSDAGCYGSEIETPAIDRLAREGVMFTRFYTVPRCSPSRASMLTGMYSQSVGVGHLDRDLGRPGYRGFLAKTIPTLPELLRKKGYRTYMAGKWHLGSGEGQYPWQRGFQRYRGLLSGANGYFALDPGRRMAEDGRELSNADLGADFYMTEDITATALRYLEEAARTPSSPFLLYVAYTAPHTPLQARSETIERCLGRYDEGFLATQRARFLKQKKLGIIPAECEFPAERALPAKTSGEAALDMAIYAAQIEDMDAGIGAILNRLDELGLAQNTVVTFVSDNGATKETPKRDYEPWPGHRRSVAGYGKNWASVSNTPWKGYKIQTHEGGVAVPCLIRFPGRFAAGMRYHRPAHMMDLAPTFLALAGVRAPRAMEGENLAAELGKKQTSAATWRLSFPSSSRLIFCEHEGNRLVLTDRYKMTRQRGEKAWALYSLEDRMELKNLAKEKRDVVRRLEQAWEKWARSHQVDVAIPSWYP
ncbi:MAG: sulfatase-like hydrolase/transferase [Akkermansiaceae bacterium]|nr:sulfatase-like hydrolase/transferase [Akkermansiaceae bacterium]